MFDLVRGVNTSSRVRKDHQDLPEQDESEDGLLYVASFSSVTVKALQKAKQLLGAETYRNAQFFDLGCGKGKTLILQSEKLPTDYPAIGIEYDKSLASIGKQNLARMKISEDLASVVEDSAVNIRTYVCAETLIVYLYNSFQGETLRETLSQISQLPHVLIYVDPAERELLQAFGYDIRYSVVGRYNADTWLVASRNL